MWWVVEEDAERRARMSALFIYCSLNRGLKK